MSQTVAEVIVETLQAAGVKHCWGVPGDTLNYVTDAIRRSHALTHVPLPR
jgi:pyruvate dehydrogenase (quinone)